jgi:hypothetical protein
MVELVDVNSVSLLSWVACAAIAPGSGIHKQQCDAVAWQAATEEIALDA